MKDNVQIIARERGKVVSRREGHNIFVTAGHEWLARLVACTSFSPETPERNDRIRYMQFGIGSWNQSLRGLTDTPPLSTSYSVGHDPNASTGYDYKKEYPIYPPISTLERPVRISGGDTDYPGDPGDVWLLDQPKLYATHLTPYSLTVHGHVHGEAGDIVYSPFFPYMPLSEIGLLTDGVGVGIHTAYSPIIAYYSFDTILMTALVEVEVIWTLRF